MDSAWNKAVEESSIRDMLDEFDFEKVRRAMAALNWVYHGKTPDYMTVDLLRETAESNLRAASECAKTCDPDDSGFVSSGGFEAHYNRYGVYRLCFVVAQSDAG